MLATSWKATGLVRKVWQSLDGPDKRGQLAERTGIQATDLSQLNTGKRPMTMALATRIASAVDGFTIDDLGAPAIEDADRGPVTVLQRLEAIEARQENVAGYLRQIHDALSAAGIAIPDPPSDDLAEPAGPQPGRRRTSRRRASPGGQA